MRFRNVHQEYEAMLQPVPGSPFPTARGKAEWKTYGDGTRQSKLKVSGLNIPDGSKLELVVENRHIATLAVQNGLARYRQESEKGEAVPLVESNQVLQVLYAGMVILEGRFYAE
jgi:hypothetical protein